MVLVGGGTWSAWRKPRFSSGAINPTDMPDGSGQKLRVAVHSAEAQMANHLANLTTHVHGHVIFTSQALKLAL